MEGVSVSHIDAALRDWWAVGRNAYMAKYGGRPAERYVVATTSGDVDALALILGARSRAGMDTTGPWRGDRTNVAEPLRALGFRVVDCNRTTTPEVQLAEQTVEIAAGRLPRPGTRQGQGFMIDQKVKLLVEAYAMKLALQHYTPLGVVVDTALRKSWDYEVDIDGECWHIEVKGTTGYPIDVILTPNEVDHAKTYPLVSLYVVSNIDIQAGPDGDRAASGGRVTLLHPWTIDDGELRPVGYKYRLP